MTRSELIEGGKSSQLAVADIFNYSISEEESRKEGAYR